MELHTWKAEFQSCTVETNVRGYVAPALGEVCAFYFRSPWQRFSADLQDFLLWIYIINFSGFYDCLEISSVPSLLVLKTPIEAEYILMVEIIYSNKHRHILDTKWLDVQTCACQCTVHSQRVSGLEDNSVLLLTQASFTTSQRRIKLCRGEIFHPRDNAHDNRN